MIARALHNRPRTVRSNERDKEREREREREGGREQEQLSYRSLRAAALCPYESKRDRVATPMCDSEREVERANANWYTAACVLPRCARMRVRETE